MKSTKKHTIQSIPKCIGFNKKTLCNSFYAQTQTPTEAYHHVGVIYNGVDVICCLN